jgi:hypothetical protein
VNIRYDATTSCKKIPVGNNALFSDFPYNGTGKKGAWVHPHQNAYLALRILWTFATVDELVAYLAERYNAGDPVTVYYALAAPIETPLTEEQLAAFREIRTAKPNTVVTNDGGAGMAVTYAADTKAYVDGENQRQSLAFMDMIDASVPEIAAEAAKLIKVPEGGGSGSVGWELVADITLTEDTQKIEFTGLDAKELQFAWYGRFNDSEDGMSNANQNVYIKVSDLNYLPVASVAMFGYVRPANQDNWATGEMRIVAGLVECFTKVMGVTNCAVSPTYGGRVHLQEKFEYLKVETDKLTTLFKSGGRFVLYKKS